ncbi:MAG: hypothetical protein Q9213_000866 [Squamulea squamosa]
MRTKLYRAADIAQALFYVYREIGFDKLIVKVEKTTNEIVLHEGEYGSHVFIPFPASLFPDETDKKAVLAYLACGDAYGYLDVFLKSVLTDIASELLEVPVKVCAQNPLNLRLFRYDGSEDTAKYQHEALKVKLKSGSDFIVDLASAQYGYHAPVVPYKTYLRTRAECFGPVRPFGYQRHMMLQSCKGHTLKAAIRKCHERLYQYFNASLDVWQQHKGPLAEMLKLSDKEYGTDRQKIIDGTDIYLRTMKEGDDKRGQFTVKAMHV